MEKESFCEIGLRASAGQTVQPAVATIWSIQYLRAFAALAVVVFHQLGYRAPIFLLGRHGVDVFFVISGFIMVTMTDDRAISPARFALDRLTRIVPLYWIATLLVFGFMSAGVSITGGSARLDWLLKSMLFVPFLNLYGQICPTLFVGWTLNLEMMFYAVFFACLYLREKLRLSMLAATLILLVCIPLFGRSQSVAAAFYSNPVILEFLAGAMLESGPIDVRGSI